MEKLDESKVDPGPVCLRRIAALTALFVGSTIAVPPGARRVTFHIRMRKNAAGAGARARFAVGWNYKGVDDTSTAAAVVPGATGTTAHESREPQTDPLNLSVVAQEAIMPVYLGAWNGPTVTAAPPAFTKWHETFEVPAGIDSVTLYVMEILDTTNLPDVAVDVAFSGAL